MQGRGKGRGGKWSKGVKGRVRDGKGNCTPRQNPGYVSGDLYNLSMRSVQLEQLKKSRILIHHGFSTLLVPIGLSICQKFLRVL
jgi:hypothetical protein